MSNYYNLDGIKTELVKEIEATTARLEAWEKVSFPTKKDGTQFKLMSKNIANATYYMDQYAMQPGEYKLRVTTWTKLNGYISSEIDVYNLVRYLKDENKIGKIQNYQPKQTYLEQVYTYDLEDIKQAVSEKIAQLKKEIVQLKAQLKKADDAYNNFRKAYDTAVKQLELDANKAENSTLYYMVIDTIKARYPYC